MASTDLTLVLLLFCTVSTTGFNLNKNGGYNLVIAIEEETKSPSNLETYSNNIQLIAQTWSNSMWEITNKKFFVNSLQLIVPQIWDLSSKPATIQSYKTADIRISGNFKYLRAENPNSCGLPGHFIESPVNFFDSTDKNGPFGTPWKALITQWARYRWGIWEEHGYPGDDTYPYFYQKKGQTGWLTTGCSDTDLLGEYKTIDNKTCDVSSDEYPGNDCRFYPNPEGQTATTSLMHFHWIDSVNHFCDETTHNKESPNRQNRNCGHRSAWEVIRESPDFKFVTDSPPTDIPQVQVKILKNSLHPRVSILLDRGQTAVDLDILESVIKGQIGRLFQLGTILKTTVAQITSFPPEDNEESVALTKTEVQWSTVENSLPFTKALNNVTTDGPERRDFASAIQFSIDELAEKNNPVGSILIVVKTGSTEGNFDNIPFEQDLLITLQDNPRIKFYGIEILEDGQSSSHLRGLSKVSNGKHVEIINSEDVDTKLGPIIDEIAQFCVTIKDPEPERNQFRGIYRGFVEPNIVNEVPILTSNLEEVEFYLTTRSEIPTEQIFMRPLFSGHYRTTVVNLIPEWTEGLETTRRFTYSLKSTRQIQENSKWLIHYECDTSLNNCDGIVHVYGRIKETIPEEETLEIILSPSSTVTDLSSPGFSNSPLTIFASIHKDGQPVIDLDITATISRQENDETWTLSLTDDGLANPDISVNDGVYSASFIPSEDGNYKIHAFVKNRPCSNENQPGLKLLLPDQKNFGCFPNNQLDEANSACQGLKLMGAYGKIVHLPGVFHVKNSNEFKAGQPFRIIDLQGSSDVNAGLITLTFTSPALISSNEQATSYTIYYSKNIEDLIGDVGSAAERLGDYPVTSSPGSLELIREIPPSLDLTFYAIETNYEDMVSRPSNIIALEMNHDLTTTTTAGTTTKEPETTEQFISTTENGEEITSTESEQISTTEENYTPSISTTSGPTSTLETISTTIESGSSTPGTSSATTESGSSTPETISTTIEAGSSTVGTVSTTIESGSSTPRSTETTTGGSSSTVVTSKTTTTIIRTTSTVKTSTIPEYDDIPEQPESSSSIWTQPQIIAALVVGIVTVLATIVFVTIQIKKRLVNGSSSMV